MHNILISVATLIQILDCINFGLANFTTIAVANTTRLKFRLFVRFPIIIHICVFQSNLNFEDSFLDSLFVSRTKSSNEWTLLRDFNKEKEALINGILSLRLRFIILTGSNRNTKQMCYL